MRGFSPREFEQILEDNGWKHLRCAGTHHSFGKTGNPYIVTFSKKGKELPRPLIQRVIKEAGLRVH